MTYATINDPTAGLIKYQRIGDLTADESTDAVSLLRITYIDPETKAKVSSATMHFLMKTKSPLPGREKKAPKMA